MIEEKLLPCPFCGHNPDPESYDTLYPTSTGWEDREIAPGQTIRCYTSWTRVPENQRCHVFNCTISEGGCGAQITADSAEKAIEKWNRRT